LIVVGFVGGAFATCTAVKNIVSTEFEVPCYLQDQEEASGASSASLAH